MQNRRTILNIFGLLISRPLIHTNCAHRPDKSNNNKNSIKISLDLVSSSSYSRRPNVSRYFSLKIRYFDASIQCSTVDEKISTVSSFFKMLFDYKSRIFCQIQGTAWKKSSRRVSLLNGTTMIRFS